MAEQGNQPPAISGPAFLGMVVFAAFFGWGALYLGAGVIDAMQTGGICPGGQRACVSWEADYWDMWWQFSRKLVGAVIFGFFALGAALGAWQYMKAD